MGGYAVKPKIAQLCPRGHLREESRIHAPPAGGVDRQQGSELVRQPLGARRLPGTQQDVETVEVGHAKVNVEYGQQRGHRYAGRIEEGVEGDDV